MAKFCDKRGSIGKKLKRIFFIFLLMIIIGGGVFGALVYYDIADMRHLFSRYINLETDDAEETENKKETEHTEASDTETGHTTEEVVDGEELLESSEFSPPDAEVYYENNSKIILRINAKESNEVYTEAETILFFRNRNFRDYPIITEYSMDGRYYDAVAISHESSEKHPIYQTYYISEYGDFWMVYLINDAIMATPVSYNMQSDLGVQLVISESNTVVSYDSITNQFYETIPNESALMVIPVEKIDAEILEKLTIKEIDDYVKTEK